MKNNIYTAPFVNAVTEGWRGSKMPGKAVMTMFKDWVINPGQDHTGAGAMLFVGSFLGGAYGAALAGAAAVNLSTGIAGGVLVGAASFVAGASVFAAAGLAIRGFSRGVMGIVRHHLADRLRASEPKSDLAVKTVSRNPQVETKWERHDTVMAAGFESVPFGYIGLAEQFDKLKPGTLAPASLAAARAKPADPAA